ncbi:MAG TPA: SCO family protein [Burkholderiaceae bacterium]|jgi:protein SCO1/2
MKHNLLLRHAGAVVALSLGALAFSVSAAEAAAAAVVAQTNSQRISDLSVYRLQSALVDQDGTSFKLEQLKGKPVIVSMFYNSCQFVCPMLIDTLKMTGEAAGADSKTGLGFLLVSFDPARDDVATLKSVARAHALDPAQWTVARTDAVSVRKLAAVLRIQYRLLPNGEFNHSTALILLDREGRIIGRSDKLGAVDPEFLAQVKRALHDQ